MKTITLSEAFAKATKGPIEAQFICGGNYALVVSEHSKFASSWTLGNIHGQGPDTENAALLAHCFNHFQEVVAALKKAAETIRDEYPNHQHSEYNLPEIEAILAKANEVTLP